GAGSRRRRGPAGRRRLLPIRGFRPWMIIVDFRRRPRGIFAHLEHFPIRANLRGASRVSTSRQASPWRDRAGHVRAGGLLGSRWRRGGTPFGALGPRAPTSRHVTRSEKETRRHEHGPRG